MAHRYRVGEQVYFRGQGGVGASGTYKIVLAMPVERADQVRYRIKNPAENFERVAEEEQLSRSA